MTAPPAQAARTRARRGLWAGIANFWGKDTKSKVIFLDRDGTINVDKDYLYRKDDFDFLPGALEALKKFQNFGYRLIIVTNQSGIARGMYTEADFKSLNDWMIDLLRRAGVEITATYYCPHHPEAKVCKYRIDCNCRKPKTGMFEKAMNSFSIDEENSWVIGDKLRDVAICKSTSMRGILLYSESEFRDGNVFRICGGLKEASEKIINGDFR